MRTWKSNLAWFSLGVITLGICTTVLVMSEPFRAGFQRAVEEHMAEKGYRLVAANGDAPGPTGTTGDPLLDEIHQLLDVAAKDCRAPASTPEKLLDDCLKWQFYHWYHFEVMRLGPKLDGVYNTHLFALGDLINVEALQISAPDCSAVADADDDCIRVRDIWEFAHRK